MRMKLAWARQSSGSKHPENLVLAEQLGNQTRPYLTQYFGTHDRALEISLNAVLRVAGHVETMGERTLPKKKQATQGIGRSVQ
jgi:hypothetical protein